MRTYTRWFCAALIGAASLVAIGSAPAEAQTDCTDTPKGQICQVQEPLVNGTLDNTQTLVDTQTQKNLGLVTVGGGCSGTLVNRSWVLTADHCVNTLAQVAGPIPIAPTAPMANLGITAAWTTRTAIPTYAIRFAPKVDVALLYLGAGDLGPANVQPFFVGSVDTTMTITKYGRGIFKFATSPLHPALSDGKYRSGQFTPDAVNETIKYVPNAAGQIANGGDSGGADFVTGPGGVNRGLAGVQSTCHASGYVSFGWVTFPTWNWAKNIDYCNSAPLADIRFDVVNAISHRAPAVSNDFDDDHSPDILWHNDATGETQIWFMNGSSVVGRADVVDDSGQTILIGAPWRIVASRDFNRDDQTDLLWYNSNTGELQVWFMNGTRRKDRATVVNEYGFPMFIGPPWSVAGANDFDGDGYADIIWHNASTGETQLWLLNGSRIARRTTVLAENGYPIFVNSPWSIVATDDMNRVHDFAPDIVWHNAVSGETQIWYMNWYMNSGCATVSSCGTYRISRRATLYWENNSGPAFVGMPFHIVGTGDFDGDTTTDILWHNETTGETQIWFMDGSQTIKGRKTVNALDGGTSLVGGPWFIRPH